MTTAAPTRDRPASRTTEAAPRTLRSDLEKMRAQIEAIVADQPLAAVATAAGIGFALGGGLTRPAIGLLIQVGSRAAMNWLTTKGTGGIPS